MTAKQLLEEFNKCRTEKLIETNAEQRNYYTRNNDN